MTRAPVVCLSHGGGPMPILGDPNHKDINYSLGNRVPQILKLNTPQAPRAIIVVTAHWSERVPTISSAARHDLLYDYHGFPKEAYSIKYNAPGAPDVASEVKAALEQQGLKPELDSERGWDHGVFIPFLLVNPKADVPIVQMSVLSSESPEEHAKMGRALAQLRDSNVAIVGSGFASFHNLREMFKLMSGDPSSASATSRKVDGWSDVLTEAVKTENAEEREKALKSWREFPNSYDMHPRGGGEHFMPLLVTAGAAGNDVAKTYYDNFAGVKIWTYYWDDVEVK